MYIIAAELYTSPSTSACPDGSISPLEQDAKSAPEVGDGFPLQLPGVPGQHTAKLPHLPLRAWMSATQGLCHQGEEGDPLLPTVLFSSPELTVMGKVEGMAGLRGCPHHCTMCTLSS